ncbi:IPT/TIG domain-containing protein [Sphingobacterium sp.]|uniref:IPT/TIG domain-containing protein n=1 Tax=Sphingobacterium sp. TaxID=341027 RepID=UPI0028987F43|nr:IPT/TIG domain-containing protein [Sphingobacterium sp.]
MKIKTIANIHIFFLLLVLGISACKKNEELGGQSIFKVNSYYPNSGNAGTLVTIEGEGFNTSVDAYQATVGGTAAEVISATLKKLVIRIPEGGVSGKLELKADGKIVEIGTYTYQDLSVAKVFPANGPAGSQIRISGAGFGSTENPAQVYINDKKALVVSASDTLIIAEIPEEAGSGAVMVKVEGKEAKGQQFTYQAIRAIKPLSGGSGTRVVITGEGFEELGQNNIVEFNGKAGLVIEASAQRLVVQAPSEVETGPLALKINNQKTTGPTFTVIGKPVIIGVTPLSGPKGSVMTISGSLFSKELDENKVYINNVLIPVESASESQLKLTIPGGTGSGEVRVVVNDQVTNGPRFKDQNLGIVSLTPDNGLAGTTVTINGTGFSTNLSENKVFFNGVLTAVKTATENKLVLDAPATLSTGLVRVVVGDQDAVSPQTFKRAGVITLAGGAGTGVFANLQGSGITVDSKGNVYVGSLNRIHKITPSGVITTFAGASESGTADGEGVSARFNSIGGLAMDENDNLFVADRFNARIRKVTPQGMVSTVGRISFNPIAMAADKQGNIYVGQLYNGVYLLNKATGGLTKLGQAMYESGDYIVPISPNEIYYAPGGTDYMKAFSMINNVKSTYFGDGIGGVEDGPALKASLRGIAGMAMNKEGVLYFMDGGRTLRKLENGIVTTLANASGLFGSVDGSFQQANFNTVTNICIDKEGNVYVADHGNLAIRKIFFK